MEERSVVYVALWRADRQWCESLHARCARLLLDALAPGIAELAWRRDVSDKVFTQLQQ